jgi:alpha-tubulin suppressor-like RCC1 family protein
MYDPIADEWQPMSEMGAPALGRARAFWSECAHIMLVVGAGLSGLAGATYDPTRDTWAPIAEMPGNGPIPEGAPLNLAWTGAELIALHSGTDARRPGAVYSVATNTWRDVTSLDAPGARTEAAIVYAPELRLMLMFGGEAASGTVGGDVSGYSPALDRWFRLSTADPPTPRSRMAALWTGDALVIWKGADTGPADEFRIGPYRTDGAIFRPAAELLQPVPTMPQSVTSNGEVPSAPTASLPCELERELACGGPAQAGRLQCDGRQWMPHDTCTAGENCDRRTATCTQIVAGCAGRSPGERYCRGRELRACGADLVADELIEACAATCVEGAFDAQCRGQATVSAGARHSCYLRDGTVRCWGIGHHGVGLQGFSAVAPELDLDGTLLQVATGLDFTCVRSSRGNARCWGDGAGGKLGYGNTESIDEPSRARDLDLGATVLQLSTGREHACALLSDNTLRCWGGNYLGQLGTGTADPEPDLFDTEVLAAATIVDVGDSVQQLSAGSSNHTCVVTGSGGVRCWGSWGQGQLGHGLSSGVSGPPAALGDVFIGEEVTQVATGGHHTCALTANGGIRCWGYGGDGQLGYGNTNDVVNVTPDSDLIVRIGGAATQVTAGDAHTCALLLDGSVRCWGLNSNGRLGYGHTENIGDDESPAQAGKVDLGGRALQISAGEDHTCAVLEDATVRCWGVGTNRRLGYSDEDDVGDDEAPAVAGPFTGF